MDSSLEGFVGYLKLQFTYLFTVIYIVGYTRLCVRNSFKGKTIYMVNAFSD